MSLNGIKSDETLYRYDPLYGFLTNDTKSIHNDPVFECIFNKSGVIQRPIVQMIVESRSLFYLFLTKYVGAKTNNAFTIQNVMTPYKVFKTKRKNVIFVFVHALYRYFVLQVEDAVFDPKIGFTYFVSDLSQNQIYLCDFSKDSESQIVYVHLEFQLSRK